MRDYVFFVDEKIAQYSTANDIDVLPGMTGAFAGEIRIDDASVLPHLMTSTEIQFERPGRRPPPDHYICRICSNKGHWIEECPQREKSMASHASSAPQVLVASSSLSFSSSSFTSSSALGHHVNPMFASTASASAVSAGSHDASFTSHVPGKLPPPHYVCQRCNVPGHYISDCPLAKIPPEHYTCHACGQKGSVYAYA